MLEALEMAEGLGTNLEAVLEKLEKLDTIESRLRQMHATLASIENVSRLDSEVEDLKTKSKQLGSTVNELKESIQFNEEDISDLKLENKKVTTRTSLPEDLLKERECKNCGATRKAG